MLQTPSFSVSDNVYEPAEDTFLLLDCLETLPPSLPPHPIVCEVGAGSGVVTTFLKMHLYKDAFFLATDLNPEACTTTKQTCQSNCGESCETLQMPLAANLRGCIDFLIFNPPYVPAESVPQPGENDWLDLALLGGEDGMVVTWKLLDDLPRVLQPHGVAFILFCARNKPNEVRRVMELRGWGVREVMTRKAGWEVLTVFEFKR